MSVKKFLFPLIYGFLLVLFTAYLLLNTFVIEKVYEIVPDAPESTQNTGKNDVYIPDTSDKKDPILSPSVTSDEYKDQNITVTLKEYREYDTTIYVADVKLSSAEHLKTAFAKNSFGRNVNAKTTVTAANNNAILAINGDFYGSREKGYVIRNGKLYRNTSAGDQEDLVIYGDGSFEIINESKTSADSLIAKGALNVLSFGPALVKDGTVSVGERDEVGKAMASNPRTAVGMIDELHYVFIVSDGRTGKSEGLTLFELANFMQSLGVKTGYNLDGGGSSTMYFNGKLINNPTTNGKKISEREVSDIVYIGY